MDKNQERLEIYLSQPTTGRGIDFGKGPEAKKNAESFAAYATERGAIAFVVLDERKRYLVLERVGGIQQSLKDQIEELRLDLEKIVSESGFLHNEVLRLSQRLDEKILQHMDLKKQLKDEKNRLQK